MHGPNPRPSRSRMRRSHARRSHTPGATARGPWVRIAEGARAPMVARGGRVDRRLARDAALVEG
eukprot:3747598-Prymnesium_polylepis.1